MPQLARDGWRSCSAAVASPLQRRHRHGSPSVRVAPVAVPLTGSARVQVAAASPCGPDSSDPVAWPCSTRSPAGKPPAKPVAAQKVSCPPPGLRLGLGQVAKTRRCAPGAFDGGSRWPARQLARGIPTTATARRWQSFGNADGWAVFSLARLRDPAKWLVPHHLPGTLRPRPPPDSSALICFAYLALHCAGSSDSAHSVPFQSATQFKQPRLAKAGRSSRSGKPSQRRSGHFVPRISNNTAAKDCSRQGDRLPDGSPQGPSSLRSSRGSNRRYTPVLADRARRQRGNGKAARETSSGQGKQ